MRKSKIYMYLLHWAQNQGEYKLLVTTQGWGEREGKNRRNLGKNKHISDKSFLSSNLQNYVSVSHTQKEEIGGGSKWQRSEALHSPSPTVTSKNTSTCRTIHTAHVLNTGKRT